MGAKQPVPVPGPESGSEAAVRGSVYGAEPVVVTTGWDVEKVISSVLKVLTILGAFGGALHAAFPTPPEKPDYERAYVLFLGATGMTGIAVKLHSAGRAAEVAAVAAAVSAAKIDTVAADVDNIRANPSMPGTPVTDEEYRARAERLSGSGLFPPAPPPRNP